MGRNNDRDPHDETMATTADMLSVVALAITVVYTDGKYDAWDAALGGATALLCVRRLRHIPPRNALASPSRVVARFGIALAIFVLYEIVLAVIRYYRPRWVEPPRVDQIILTTEIFHVLAVVVLFGVVTLYDRLWVDVHHGRMNRWTRIFYKRQR